MTDVRGHCHVARPLAPCAAVFADESKGGNASLEQDENVPLGNGGATAVAPFFLCS